MNIATINMNKNRLFALRCVSNLENTVVESSFRETNKTFNPAVFFVWFLCLWFHMKI